MKFNPSTVLTGGIISLWFWKDRSCGFSKYLCCFCFLVKDFQVNISAESTFTAGKSLELVCLVVGGGWDPQLQGVWFFNGKEVARMDAGGVLDLKRGYKERAIQGQLQVSKLSPKAFSLKIFSVGPEDEGAYRCTVAEMARAQMGSWQVLQSKQSPDTRVHLRKPAGTWSQNKIWPDCSQLPSFVSTGCLHGHSGLLLKSQVSAWSLWGGIEKSDQTSWRPESYSWVLKWAVTAGPILNFFKSQLPQIWNNDVQLDCP